MAYNSINSGIQKTNQQNISSVEANNVRNNYDRSYPNFMTCDYAHVTPFFHEEVVNGDSLRLRPGHIMRTHTLASPLFTHVQGHKAFFEVPMKHILPHTWDRFFVNPTHGDDVPDDILPKFDVHKLIEYVAGKNMSDSYETDLTYTDFATTSSGNSLQLSSWHWLALFIQLVSSQNLLSLCGIPSIGHFVLPNTRMRVQTGESNFTNTVFNHDITSVLNSAILNVVNQLAQNTESRSNLVLQTVPPSGTGQSNVVYYEFNLATPQGFRRMLDFVLQHPIIYVNYDLSTITSSQLAGMWSNVIKYRVSNGGVAVPFNLYFWSAFLPSSVNPGQNDNVIWPKLDISKLIAYHMVCAQYFTNSNIDDIYTSELWRQAMLSFWYNGISVSGNTPLPRYTYNGVSMEYDLFSEKSLDMLLSAYMTVATNTSQYVPLWSFIVNLFTMEKSLVYGDYFTGSRLQPLAVGDTQVRVSGNYVDVVDITKSIVKQRFLNKVNRLRSDIVSYSRGIFGTTPKSAECIPEYLVKIDFEISNQQVDNTADNQGNIVTNMVSSDSGNAQITFDATEPGIVLGLMYFTLPRVYSAGLDRLLFKTTRFDMFQPDLQNIGDQHTYLAEYDVRLCLPNKLDTMNSLAYDAPFAYRERDAEYKQRVGVASGGFVTSGAQLQSWANVYDLNRFQRDGTEAVLNSEMLRNNNEDFDKFYSQLSNVVPGMYYHFIFGIQNDCEIIRNMYYQPEIL